MSGDPQAILGLVGSLSLVGQVPRFGKLCLLAPVN